MVLELMALGDLLGTNPVLVQPVSPDPRDPGKFLIDGKVARAIHHFSGWNLPISPSWFVGGFDQPEIHGQPFFWYAFAIPATRHHSAHYFLCDFLQMREWVLDFDAPLGRDHRDHFIWRADLRVFDQTPERTGYFRWGDEPVGTTARPNRVFELDNLSSIPACNTLHVPVGARGPGGESSAHRLLKEFVAAHPTDFGLSIDAVPWIEHRFATGDRVDVMFGNHAPDRTVVEIEVEGEENVCVGIKQAIKYRVLAEVDEDYGPASKRVGSLVVAYDVAYPKALALSDRYGVQLRSVDRERVLTAAS
ncbi:hypothetical protein ACE2AJ_00325 [Aquihabitans daechungensis]|uniref:hypothetical protein n=1 Tax=Aquihabitans daechungensis TaxID=1052257 RepID=UPI003BA1EE5D